MCTSKRSLVSRDVIKRQNPISNTDVVTCMTCCDDDFCNIDGCGQIGSIRYIFKIDYKKYLL